jgi:peroxiredoxin
MVSVHSTMLPLGTVAPPFRLPDPEGRLHDLDTLAEGAPALLVMFLSNHCPYVKHVAAMLAGRTSEWIDRGVAVVAIMSNDVEGYPDDRPDRMAAEVEQRGYRFPYLYDETQEVARAYRAACTPDFFLFDGDRRLAYRGQLDDSRPRNDAPVTGDDLARAVDAVLAGEAVPEPHHPSMGCNIKWRPGNEPDYFG